MLNQMTWPPLSPDLNPIEIVWDELGGRVNEKQPTSAQYLWELLQDCCKTLPGGSAKSVKSVHIFCVAS